MRWGVTYSALLVNGVFTMEVFLLTKNLLTLTLALPIHGICALLCSRDPRFFDLLLLWGRTRIPALLANARLWKASTYSPLTLDLPRPGGQRRTTSPVLDTGTALVDIGAHSLGSIPSAWGPPRPGGLASCGADGRILCKIPTGM